MSLEVNIIKLNGLMTKQRKIRQMLQNKHICSICYLDIVLKYNQYQLEKYKKQKPTRDFGEPCQTKDCDRYADVII